MVIPYFQLKVSKKEIVFKNKPDQLLAQLPSGIYLGCLSKKFRMSGFGIYSRKSQLNVRFLKVVNTMDIICIVGIRLRLQQIKPIWCGIHKSHSDLY